MTGQSHAAAATSRSTTKSRARGRANRQDLGASDEAAEANPEGSGQGVTSNSLVAESALMNVDGAASQQTPIATRVGIAA